MNNLNNFPMRNFHAFLTLAGVVVVVNTTWIQSVALENVVKLPIP